MTPIAGTLIGIADDDGGRVEHVNRLIEPSLKKANGICDRFFDSTLTYQGIAGGLGRWCDQCSKWRSVKPCLMLPSSRLARRCGLQRAEKRGGAARFEEEAAFHRDVRDGFWRWRLDPKRIVVVDAENTFDASGSNRRCRAL